ncbi:hypothetical protein Mal52_13850 [Symmachiella dynata]|uniref:Uncharacterized protein n=1 Tax=Symmachiella dynata TaxID=2527995 RepID=A0A517ZKD9_9PLAN|nr:hypothetical protein [Symmachiella dynata]QDU42915.1 hypothetical protein Mal52_13850 [Symmachiella dynata]
MDVTTQFLVYRAVQLQVSDNCEVLGFLTPPGSELPRKPDEIVGKKLVDFLSELSFTNRVMRAVRDVLAYGDERVFLDAILLTNGDSHLARVTVSRSDSNPETADIKFSDEGISLENNDKDRGIMHSEFRAWQLRATGMSTVDIAIAMAVSRRLVKQLILRFESKRAGGKANHCKDRH